ncbi:hypothetical protein AGMMS50218_15670 [Actinomycetota bacterium]|nr:hypothetical protein AGMMS50218_15670 [Actinomycetota bacterium]
MLLRELRHVELDQRVLVPEQELGERLGQLGLPDARGAGEDERATGTLRVLEPGARAADRLGQRLDGRLLADDPLVQLVLHVQQPRRLRLGQLEHRDAGRDRQHLGDQLLVHLGDGVQVTGLPGLLLVRALEAELLLLVPQACGLLEVLLVDRRLLVATRLGDLLVELAQLRGSGHPADAQAGAGLVDQVDRLVGEEPVVDVAVRERRGGHERAVRDGHAVVRLVPVAQALEDLDGVLERGLGHLDRLEPALQGRVLLDVLAVLLERGRTDGLQLAAGQHRLEDARRVDRALGGTRTHEGVDLVDEQDDVAARADLLEDLLQALLEVTAVPAAGHERAEVERVELLVLQRLRHVAAHDVLREALDDGGLADAGLPDEDRVVLGAAGQHLHDPLDLLLAPDDRVELAVARRLREVAPELVEHGRAGGLALGGAAGRDRLLALVAGQELDDLLADLVQVGAELAQDLRGDTLALADEPEQDVLGPDVVVAELQRLAQGQLQHLLGARRERDVPARRLLALADDLLHLRAHGIQRDAQRLEGLGGDALTLVDQTQEDVLGADVVVVEHPRLFLGEDDHATGSVRESLEHVHSSRAACLASGLQVGPGASASRRCSMLTVRGVEDVPCSPRA